MTDQVNQQQAAQANDDDQGGGYTAVVFFHGMGTQRRYGAELRTLGLAGDVPVEVVDRDETEQHSEHQPRLQADQPACQDAAERDERETGVELEHSALAVTLQHRSFAQSGHRVDEEQREREPDDQRPRRC